MTHFEELLVTVGGTKSVLTASAPHWDFWTVEYPTPAGSVQARYLYLKWKCPNQEATPDNLRKWLECSGGRGYEVIVPPRSPLSLKLDQTQRIFLATQARTSKTFLFESILADLSFRDVDQEEHFIDPDLELPSGKLEKQATRFLVRWILAEEVDGSRTGLAVLRAHGGIGKTTTARVLCNRIRAQDAYSIPILIEASHWQALLQSTIQMRSIWDIAISRTFERPSRLLSNEVALRVLIREGIFIPIFDGFDELCLNPASPYQAEDLINELMDILDAGEEIKRARILLTTRETFWENIREKVETDRLHEFRLSGFSNDQKHDYFKKCLTSDAERDVAQRIASQVSGALYSSASIDGPNAHKPAGVPNGTKIRGF